VIYRSVQVTVAVSREPHTSLPLYAAKESNIRIIVMQIKFHRDPKISLKLVALWRKVA